LRVSVIGPPHKWARSAGVEEELVTLLTLEELSDELVDDQLDELLVLETFSSLLELELELKLETDTVLLEIDEWAEELNEDVEDADVDEFPTSLAEVLELDIDD
jgi:hypothetical protein